MATVYIALGTNLGNREDNLLNAIGKISASGIKVLKESSVLETDPVDYFEQPVFLNQIIMVDTDYDPLELLDIMQRIEKSMGKNIVIPKGPRLIDLDILIYDDIVFSNERLSIPHKGIMERDFILKHLVELNRELIDPASGKKYIEVTL